MNKISKIILINFFTSLLITIIVLSSVFLVSYYIKSKGVDEINLASSSNTKIRVNFDEKDINNKKQLVPFDIYDDNQSARYTPYKRVLYNITFPDRNSGLKIKLFVNDNGNSILRSSLYFATKPLNQKSSLDSSLNDTLFERKEKPFSWEYYIAKPKLDKNNQMKFLFFVQIKNPQSNQQSIQGEKFALHIQFEKI